MAELATTFRNPGVYGELSDEDTSSRSSGLRSRADTMDQRCETPSETMRPQHKYSPNTMNTRIKDPPETMEPHKDVVSSTTSCADRNGLETKPRVHQKLIEDTAKNASSGGGSNTPDAMESQYEDVISSKPRAHVWGLGTLLTRSAETLEVKPLVLKCLISGLVGALGDLVAQCIFWAQGGGVVWHDTNAVRQTVAVTFNAFAFNAPFQYFAYNFLDWWIPADEKVSHAAMQVAVDIFVLNPVYALVFIITTGYMEGKSTEEYIIPTIRADYLPLVFWLTVLGLLFAPCHVYLFKEFPLKWRVLIADALDVLWTVIAVLSISRAD